MTRRRLLALSAAAVVVAAAGIFALYWFQPWKLVVDRQVNDALTPTTAPAIPSPAVEQPAPGPRTLVEGTFITHEHDTTGTVRIVQAADGKRRLELVGLDTSNGPDLRIWLTDQPVIEGRDGWEVFDDGKYHEVARLKGNKGNQVYDIPADLDITQFRSVSIWCKRFAVSFGAAPLSAA